MPRVPSKLTNNSGCTVTMVDLGDQNTNKDTISIQALQLPMR